MIFKDEILNKILAGASISLFIRTAGVILMLVAHALLVRSMGDHNYGIFVYAVSIIPILALLAKSGFQISSLRFLQEYNESNKIALKTGYIRRSFQIPLLISTAIFITGTSVGFLVDGLPEIIGESAKYASWIIVLFALAYIAQQILRAMKKIVYSQIFEQIFLPLILIILSTYFILSNNVLGYQYAFTVHGLTYLFVALVCWVLIFKLTGINLKSNYKYETIKWIKVSLPLGLVGVGTVFMTRMDVVMLGFFINAEEIALYSVSSRIASLSVFCMAALSAITGPYIAEYHHNKRTLELKLLMRKIVFLAIAINLLFWVLLFGFGDYLLLAFGEQYIPLKTIMLILAAGRLSDIGLALVGPILTISGHQKEYMYFLILMSSVLLVALYFSVNSFGLMGAAIATTSVLLMTNIFLFVLVNKYVGINIFTRN